VQERKCLAIGGTGEFFYYIVIDDTLTSHFRTSFELHEFGYGLDEIETMLPWERDVHLSMVAKRLKEREEALQKKNG